MPLTYANQHLHFFYLNPSEIFTYLQMCVFFILHPNVINPTAYIFGLSTSEKNAKDNKLDN
jgi:hypothetical protein